MKREKRHLVALGAAHILAGRVPTHARREADERQHGFPVGHRIEEISRDDSAHRRVRDVDHRRLPGHGDRLLERSHRQLDIDRRGEIGRQFEAVTFSRLETGQRKRDAVGANRQVHDLVLTLPVGHDRAHSLDQRRTGRFHSDAGQHRARRIFHGPRDGRAAAGGLSGHRCRERHAPQGGDDREDSAAASHDSSSSQSLIFCVRSRFLDQNPIELRALSAEFFLAGRKLVHL